MPRRIISWKINELCDEPRVTPSLSTASFVMVITEATGIQLTEIGAKLTNWLASVKPAADESFVRHDTYFFKDGNITFLVRDAPYCAPSSQNTAVGRRHALLCPSILSLSGLDLLLHQVLSA
jgi:hypothetical protein